MSKAHIIIAALAATVGSASLAKAEFVCDARSNPIEIYDNYSADVIVKVWGGFCPHEYKTRTATITSSHIVIKPKHGSLKIMGANKINYIPEPNYKGPDNYAIKFCGFELEKKGCATFNIDATVQ